MVKQLLLFNNTGVGRGGGFRKTKECRLRNEVMIKTLAPKSGKVSAFFSLGTVNCQESLSTPPGASKMTAQSFAGCARPSEPSAGALFVGFG